MIETDKGVCRLSVVPVRASVADKSEIVTQLLFGDHYSVLEESKDHKWLKIKIFFDDYEGWIDKKQHYSISEEYFEQINHSDYKICTDVTAGILFKKHHLNILIGSILPISSNDIFKAEEQMAFTGNAKSLNQKRDFDFLKEVALKYLHAPYLWGGKSPFGIDCSGFTQQVFKICGFRLSREAREQVLQGEEIKGIENSHPGDLAFFGKEGKINHVGIIFPHNEIIHASGYVRIDKIDNDGIYLNDINIYTHKLMSIRRIIRL